MKLLILIVLALIICRLIFILYNSKTADATYNQISGDKGADKILSKKYKKKIKNKNDPTILDYYRVGSLYDYVEDDPLKASAYYLKCLKRMNKKNVFRHHHTTPPLPLLFFPCAPMAAPVAIQYDDLAAGSPRCLAEVFAPW